MNNPEYIDPSTNEPVPTSRTLTKKEEESLCGILTGQSGEIAENVVFNEIGKLSCQSHKHPFLALFNFALDNDNQRRLKLHTLHTELPSIPPSLKTNIELDSIVFVRDVGVVGIEVKSRRTPAQLQSAEQQLTNGKVFFQTLMATLESNPSSLTLPYVRVIVFPHEPTPSPKQKTSEGSIVLH